MLGCTLCFTCVCACVFPRYVAMFPYTPRKDDELELRKGEMFLVLERCQDGWFKGTSMHTGKMGVFPGNYMSPVSRYGAFFRSLFRALFFSLTLSLTLALALLFVCTHSIHLLQCISCGTPFSFQIFVMSSSALSRPFSRAFFVSVLFL